MLSDKRPIIITVVLTDNAVPGRTTLGESYQRYQHRYQIGVTVCFTGDRKLLEVSSQMGIFDITVIFDVTVIFGITVIFDITVILSRSVTYSVLAVKALYPNILLVRISDTFRCVFGKYLNK